MLKQDQPCGGDNVPVTFAEFDVQGAEPVDVFHTMLDTPAQKAWNPQMSSVKSLGDWKAEGARAWAVIFALPLISAREFVQWQVADANFSSQEFWLVFSTQNNGQLKKVNPIQSGATESQNCLGAYHITKKAGGGAHVIVTQQVNAHPFFAFPLHQVLNLFPPAWKGTMDFVKQMSGRARYLATSGSTTDVPQYMLQGPQVAARTATAAPVPAGDGRDQSQNVRAAVGATTSVAPIMMVDRAETFPELQSTSKSEEAGFTLFGSGASFVMAPLLCLCFAAAGFGAGRCAGSKVQAWRDDNARETFFTSSRGEDSADEEEGML
jgi:hypothetical protein